MAALFTAAVLVGRATRMDETGLALIWPAAGVGVLWVALARGPAPARREPVCWRCSPACSTA